MRKLHIIAAAAALLVAASAWAGQPGNNGNGQGGCGQGQSTNGCGTTAPPAGDPGSINNGGQGGNAAGGVGVGVGIGTGLGIGHGGNASAAGGAGGNATANGGAGGSGGVGIGGSVAGSGNSNVLSTNANSNRNSNRQSQTAQGGTASSASGGNTLATGSQSVSVSGDSVSYAAQERNPVNTAYAPNIAPTATCMGSTSGGAQGIGFGISIGSTWTAQECQTLEQGRFAAQVLGQTDVAGEIACALDKYREARKRLGKPCASDGGNAASAGPAASVAQATPGAQPADAEARKRVAYWGIDPIVMQRLGLAPLKQ